MRRVPAHSLRAVQQAKGTALVGCDMIALVALYFVLGIVFGRVMLIAFVVEVSRVDGDDSARHPTRFGIPADMIANSELLGHVAILSVTAAPERRLRISETRPYVAMDLIRGDPYNQL